MAPLAWERLEWLGAPAAELVWLGQEPGSAITPEQQRAEEQAAAAAAAKKNGWTTIELILLASLTLGVISFAWNVYVWNKTHPEIS